MTAKAEDLPNKAITTYTVERISFHDRGLIQVPALGNAPAIFVRVRGETEGETIRWTATCRGGNPKVPTPLETPWGLNSNMVLLSFTQSTPVRTPIGGADPGHVISVSGEAVYGRFVAEGIVRDYPTGRQPDEAVDLDYGALPKESFQSGILDPATSVAPLPPLQSPIQGP